VDAGGKRSMAHHIITSGSLNAGRDFLFPRGRARAAAGGRRARILGFCIGGPFIWNLLQRADDMVIAAVPAQPSDSRPEMPTLSYDNNMRGWGPDLCARRPDITLAMVDKFLTNMYRARADFVLYRDARIRPRLPDADPCVAGRCAWAPVCRRQPSTSRRTRKCETD
jgi:hypothetical protein